MRIARPIAALFLLLPLGLGAQTVTIQPAQATKVTETRTLPLASGSRLAVKNVNGRIRVVGWDREEVQFTGAFTPGSDNTQVKVVLEPGQGELEIRGEYPKGERSRGPVCDMELKVPRRVAASLSNVNGEVELSDLQGKTQCSTVNGGIQVSQVTGAVHLKTVNGSIQAKELSGPIQGKTVNGDITLTAKGLKGRLKATTLNGSLSCKAPGAEELKASKRSLEAVFPGGDQPIEFKTLNGNVTIL